MLLWTDLFVFLIVCIPLTDINTPHTQAKLSARKMKATKQTNMVANQGIFHRKQKHTNENIMKISVTFQQIYFRSIEMDN